MASTIESIHQQTRDSEEPLTEVATRAVYLATVLRQKPVTDWLKCELRGYAEDDEPPAYRRHVKGTLVARLPGQGWIDAPVLDPLHDEVARTDLRESIHALEQLHARSRRTGNYRLEFPEKHQAELKTRVNLDSDLNLLLSSGSLGHILETLRLTIGFWTEDLLKAKLQGDGLSFRLEDRQAAAPLGERLDDYMQRAAAEASARVAAAQASATANAGFFGRLIGRR